MDEPDIKLKLNQTDIEGRFNWQGLLEKYKIPLILGTGGIILVGLGVLAVLWETRTEDKIEILSADTATKSVIHADIEGAVVEPGVYQLPSGSRVDDLLIAAGGLSALADRDWIEKTLNRAQKLTDGVKIYVPEKSTTSSKSATGITSQERKNVLININTASQAELDALPGIGPVTAQKIIENRPYQAVDDLLTKKILKSNVFQRIADQLTVY